jgi:hypothetical protein
MADSEPRKVAEACNALSEPVSSNVTSEKRPHSLPTQYARQDSNLQPLVPKTRRRTT